MHDVKLIAFYLPQFHPIPENDAWWGSGFTEWVNVRRARPNFVGHYQPHVPAELGYYDLRAPETRAAQAELARQHGIHGFCYYHYWFNGRRLLERPLNAVIESGEPDFPFCVCWANENWSRRWDGGNDELLIAQEYSAEHERRFIEGLLPVLEDRRYIRVGGRPLLLVYRANLLPEPRRAAETFRRVARIAGVGETMPRVHPAPGVAGSRCIGFRRRGRVPAARARRGAADRSGRKDQSDVQRRGSGITFPLPRTRWSALRGRTGSFAA